MGDAELNEDVDKLAGEAYGGGTDAGEIAATLREVAEKWERVAEVDR